MRKRQQYKWVTYARPEVDHTGLAQHLNVEGNIGWIVVQVFDTESLWRVLLRRPMT
jgi:hypothetical protein